MTYEEVKQLFDNDELSMNDDWLFVILIFLLFGNKKETKTININLGADKNV